MILSLCCLGSRSRQNIELHPKAVCIDEAMSCPELQLKLKQTYHIQPSLQDSKTLRLSFYASSGCCTSTFADPGPSYHFFVDLVSILWSFTTSGRNQRHLCEIYTIYSYYISCNSVRRQSLCMFVSHAFASSCDMLPVKVAALLSSEIWSKMLRADI